MDSPLELLRDEARIENTFQWETIKSYLTWKNNLMK